MMCCDFYREPMSQQNPGDAHPNARQSTTPYYKVLPRTTTYYNVLQSRTLYCKEQPRTTTSVGGSLAHMDHLRPYWITCAHTGSLAPIGAGSHMPIGVGGVGLGGDVRVWLELGASILMSVMHRCRHQTHWL